MAESKARLREEVAELAEAVRELREELAQQRVAAAVHHLCGCHGYCWHWTPVVQPTVTYGITITCAAPSATSSVFYGNDVTAGTSGMLTIN